MNWLDVLLAAGILAAAGWVFYKSYIKKKGSCAGCCGCPCSNDRGERKDRLIRLS